MIRKWTTSIWRCLLLTALVSLPVGLIMVWQIFWVGMADGTTQALTTKGLIMKLTAWPTIVAIIAMSLLTACGSLIESADEGIAKWSAEKAAEQAKVKHKFSAQVVGLQWLDPLMWMDYPTEWNLLWTLGLVKGNSDDKQVQKKPALYGKVQPVAGIAFSFSGTATFKGFFDVHIEKLFEKYGSPYFTNGNYFYTVQPKNPKDWRELAGIRVEAALPSKLNAEESAVALRKELTRRFSIGAIADELSTSKTPPDIHITQGGPSAGFTSLSAALDYLEAHPDKTVWVMSFDAPNFPKDTQMNESSVLLILAHPSFKTEREPLAWIHRPSTRKMQDYEVKAGKAPRIVQAWSAAIADAADRGDVPVMSIGKVIHDAGMGSATSSERIGALGQTLTEMLPEFHFHKQTFNSVALLGDLGASTALTNIALGIAYAHHKNEPVIVANTTDITSATTLLIRPPSHPRPFDPEKSWFRARSGRHAYLPWWGRRHDDKRDLMQGGSE